MLTLELNRSIQNKKGSTSALCAAFGSALLFDAPNRVFLNHGRGIKHDAPHTSIGTLVRVLGVSVIRVLFLLLDNHRRVIQVGHDGRKMLGRVWSHAELVVVAIE